jgi:bifunctional non-homologous end joining protein LigD
VRQNAVQFIAPAIPTLVDKPPEGAAWFHEIKYDGYRTQLAIADGDARAFTRNGHDWTAKYRHVVDTARKLIGQSALLDGEMVIQDDAGRSSFNALQRALKWRRGTAVFYAFDLLHKDGKDLRRLPCEERRAKLADLIGEPGPDSPLQFSQAYEGSGAEFFRAVDQTGLEGIVSKRRDSAYRSGHTRDWLKTKAYTQGEFVVVGYERKRGAAPSLLLAAESDDGLKYVGRAIPAISGRAREALWARLEELTDYTFATWITDKHAVPTRPELRVMARHLRGEQELRHATVTAVLN